MFVSVQVGVNEFSVYEDSFSLIFTTEHIYFIPIH